MKPFYIHIARNWPIMLIFYLLCYAVASVYKSYLLCSKLCPRIRIVLNLFLLSMYRICVNKSLLIYRQFRKIVLLGLFIDGSKILCVLSDNDCSIWVYQSFVANFQIYIPLCLMLLVTCYAQNYAGIIGWSLYIVS